LAGCGSGPDARPARALHALLAGRPVAWRTLAMPRRARGGEFDFECDVFGDRIDSRKGTYTWLLGDSTDRPNVARFTLSSADRDSIWSWLLNADYFDMPREMQHAQGVVVPRGIKSKLEVRIRKAQYVAEVEEAFGALVAPGSDRGAELEALGDRITRLVMQKPEVQALPRPSRHGWI